jgi:hypothetical protein
MEGAEALFDDRDDFDEDAYKASLSSAQAAPHAADSASASDAAV